MIFIGLDVSYRATGFVALNAEGQVLRACEIGEKAVTGLGKNSENDLIRIEKITEKIMCEVRALEKDGQEIQLSMEGYAFARNFGMAAFGELGGVLKYKLYDEFGMPRIISPGQVKKFATGKGSGKKALILKEVFRRWGHNFDSDNIADAYVLARIILDGYKYKRGEIDKTWIKPQIETLKVIFGGIEK